jgi:hypothetical protein
MVRIFISYRRSASAGQAGRLYDHLKQVFGEQNVFLDTEQIPAGETFESHILGNIRRCDVFLALLSKGTLDRIYDPGDWVRREFAYALKLKRSRVIPVLIDGFPMPKSEEFPDDVRSLADRNAISIRHEVFEETVLSLIKQIQQVTVQNSSKIGKNNGYFGCFVGTLNRFVRWLWRLPNECATWATVLSFVVALVALFFELNPISNSSLTPISPGSFTIVATQTTIANTMFIVTPSSVALITTTVYAPQVTIHTPISTPGQINSHPGGKKSDTPSLLKSLFVLLLAVATLATFIASLRCFLRVRRNIYAVRTMDSLTWGLRFFLASMVLLVLLVVVLIA